MKTKRQNKIMELVESHEIETQEELAELLAKAGFPVTQATISRDIRELSLIKVNIEGKRQKYVQVRGGEEDMNDRYVRVLRDGFVAMDMAQNILVINTVSGMAMAVATALDAMKIEGIVGCIAGDDTIMCAIRSIEQTLEVMKKIKELVTV